MRKRQALIVLGLVFGDVDVGFILTPAAFSAERKGAISEELRLLKEETVSIAVRHEQPISESPSDVYVITDEDIRHSGATDIATILRRVPGMDIIEMSAAQLEVSARGDNKPSSNSLLVMIDGRSIYIDLSGSNSITWKSIPVSLLEIKRIEVLKGPASALYGFNAFDGVVNIITKSPEEMKGTMLQFGGGEFGTLTASAVQAGTYNKLGYRLSIGRDQNNQWRDRNALAFRDHKFNLHTEYELPNQAKIVLGGGLVDVNRFDGIIATIVTDATTFSDEYAKIAYERPNFFIRSFWRQMDFSSDQIVTPALASFFKIFEKDKSTTSKLTGNTYDLESQHTINVGADQFTYGFNYRHNTISGNGIDESSGENRLGLFVQNEWSPTERLILTGGVRYDLHTEVHGTLSPRVALLFKPDADHAFRATASIAYRPPTLFEGHQFTQETTTLPLPPPFNIIPTVAIGSKNLSPEQIISYEVGYQGWFLKHRLRVRGDLFYNQLSDLINVRRVSLQTVTYANDAGQAEIYGGETGVEFLATRWLTGFANFSYEEISQTLTDFARRGAPRFKFNVGLRGEWENGLSAEAVLHHVGSATYPNSEAFSQLARFGVVAPDERVGSYNLLNLRGAYRFWKEKAELAISVFNALNDRHKEHPLGDTIGSRVMGWLTIRF